MGIFLNEHLRMAEIHGHGGGHPSWDGRDTWTWGGDGMGHPGMAEIHGHGGGGGGGGGVTHPAMAEIHGQGWNGMGHPSWDGRDTGDTMIGVVYPIL